MNKCISLKDMSRYRMIDSLRELGYYDTNGLYEMSMNELKRELYNRK